ncbi:hypothetical protein NDU88_005538 [Pleurodeles waltl]|uniref:Uncharacterized protein n=1 Tax=Pleurodeles waltl TaxID=8319 RepID=A0AAV7QF13_PLEWA|nr:hypothetical protein NDU88_005538 [Pleurodeles waltl]
MRGLTRCAEPRPRVRSRTGGMHGCSGGWERLYPQRPYLPAPRDVCCANQPEPTSGRSELDLGLARTVPSNPGDRAYGHPDRLDKQEGTLSTGHAVQRPTHPM